MVTFELPRQQRESQVCLSDFVAPLRDGKPVDADVTIGISAGGMTEIASGLSEGDRVVVPEPRTLLR